MCFYCNSGISISLVCGSCRFSIFHFLYVPCAVLINLNKVNSATSLSKTSEWVSGVSECRPKVFDSLFAGKATTQHDSHEDATLLTNYNSTFPESTSPE